MRKFHRRAPTLLAAISLSAAIGVLLPQEARADQKTHNPNVGWQLNVVAPQPWIYVREPLKLRATLQYTGEKAFRGALTNLERGYTFLLITSGGKSRTLFLPSTRRATTGSGIALDFKTYAPGYQEPATFSILFDFDQSKYVFEEVGTYQIKLMSRLFQGTSYEDAQTLDVQSNAVQVTVVDAPQEWKPAVSLWSGPEQVHVLLAESYFQPERDQKQGLQKLKDLIRLYPTTPYAQIARRHLKKIGDPELNALFSEDKRLDVQVEVDFPEQTPLAQFLAFLTQQSGVPLSPSDEFKRVTISTLKRTTNLRAEMQRVSQARSRIWVKRGNGYLLTRVEPEPDE